MKTRLLFCFAVFGVLSAAKNPGVGTTANLYHPERYRVNHLALHPAIKAKKAGLLPLNGKVSGISPNKSRRSAEHPLRNHGLTSARPAALDSVTELLRLKLYIDPNNYDDIVIGFNSGASPAYNYNEDSEYLPGVNAAEGLCSFSSDGVPLSINLLPLPKQTPDVIRLDVEAQNSGPITLKRTELDPLPKIYEIWLVDNYKKDSLDLRVDSNYAFVINKSDTASYGGYRFKVVVRQGPALAFQLLGFNAVKEATGAQITWTTENEENYTHFAVERSSDGGSTFNVLDSLVSTGAGSYSFTDKSPPPASDEYRLRMTDFNGTVSYSNVITLLYGNTVNTITGNISVYPNPTNGMINLAINQNNTPSQASPVFQNTGLTFFSLAADVNGGASYNIKIMSISGAVMKTATSSAASWQDNVSRLSPGTYIITVVDNNNNKLVGRSTFVKL